MALVRDADIQAGKDTLLAEQEIGRVGEAISKLEKRIAVIRARSLAGLHAKANVIGQEEGNWLEEMVVSLVRDIKAIAASGAAIA